MFRRTMMMLLCSALVVSAFGRAHADETKREKVREKVRAIIAAKLIEHLDLDEKTTVKLLPVLKKFHDDLAAIHKDSGAARRDLRKLVGAGGKIDDAKVNKIVDRLIDNHAKAAKLEQQMAQDVRKILTPVQTAKLLVILPRLRAKLEHRIRQAAGDRGGPGDDGGGDDDDDD